MTAQILDKVVYQDNIYDLYGVKGEKLFSPLDFGMETGGVSCTACYRGFHCKYTVSNGELQLTEMNIIGIKDGNVKPIGGKLPVNWSPTHSDLGTEYAATIKAQEPGVRGGHYPDLGLVTPFTGSLLISGDANSILIQLIHFTSPTFYSQIIELAIANGKVIKQIDYSERVTSFRSRKIPFLTVFSTCAGLESPAVDENDEEYQWICEWMNLHRQRYWGLDLR